MGRAVKFAGRHPVRTELYVMYLSFVVYVVGKGLL